MRFLCHYFRFVFTFVLLSNSFVHATMFTNPGIATFKDGEWVGSEDLYNLSLKMGLVVEIVQPPGQPAILTENGIKDKVIPILKIVGITSREMNVIDSSALVAAAPPPPKKPVPKPGSPKVEQKPKNIVPKDIPIPAPLPFLHILVMLQPIEKGYAVYCTGRLFEAVDLHRINLRGGIYWQAITWEKQELLIVSKEQLQEQVDKSVQTIASAFADRFKSDEEKALKPPRRPD